MKNNFKRSLICFKIFLLAGTLAFVGCKKDDGDTGSSADGAYTITVGVYLLNGNTYEDQNKDLVFVTQEACQSWSRTAQGDDHDAGSHDHFNAAKNTTYNADTETITWLEYGPTTDQASIDSTCDDGSDGATKTANKTDYSADKNFYLQIKSVVEN